MEIKKKKIDQNQSTKLIIILNQQNQLYIKTKGYSYQLR